jgi:hypothetical protein
MIDDKRGVMVRTIIITVLAVFLLILVIYGVGQGQLMPLFERVGARFDDAAIWIGLKDDDSSRGCFSDKVIHFEGGEKLANELELDREVSVMKVCKDWCRAGIGDSGSLDGTYLAEFDKNNDMSFSVWRGAKPSGEAGLYIPLGTEVFGEVEKFNRELYLAMVDKVKNLKVWHDDAWHDARLGDWGIISNFGRDVGDYRSGTTGPRDYVYGHKRDDGICLMIEPNYNNQPWIEWKCKNDGEAGEELLSGMYHSLKNFHYYNVNNVTFRGKSYRFVLNERLSSGLIKVDLNEPFISLEIGDTKYAVISRWQTSWIGAGIDPVRSEHWFTFYINDGNGWVEQKMDKQYYLYAPVTKKMEGLGKIRDFMEENCV